MVLLIKIHGTIDAPIARKPNSIIERWINEDGDSSTTHYETLDRVNDNNLSYSIVKCYLETGRTHQIRVHMKHIGHPLLGDTLYFKPSTLISRQALHAYRVTFVHPLTKQKVAYIAPLPEDMNKLCKNVNFKKNR